MPEGNPQEAILKTATIWEADLIVMGTHSRTGLSHFLLGSVAEHVVRHAAIPVMVIPSK
jgi:nucleotide-binding universal stress UspA family protein